MTRRRFEHTGFSWLKLFIILLVITSMVGAVIIGYLAFAHQLPPIIGAASFIVIVGLLIWLSTLLRKSRMRYHTPRFTLVFLSLVGITLICAFAGVEPLAAYKDNLLNYISGRIQNVSTSDKSNNTEPDTTNSVREASILQESVAETPSKEDDIEMEVLNIVNSERADRNIAPLAWNCRFSG